MNRSALVALLVCLFLSTAPARADWTDGTAAGALPDPQSALPALLDSPAKRIEVSLSTQHLVAWEGERAVFEFAVTTGQEGQPTISGEYEILDKEMDAYSYAWGMSLPFWLGFYQFGELENGFHALPLTPDGEELWGDALGVYPASHGCVVMSPVDAQKLYDWAQVGTLVVIRD